MKQLPLTPPTVAAVFASALALTGCVQHQGPVNLRPHASQGIAQDTPFRGAPVTILDAAQGHIVFVPQRSARSLSEATCRVATTLPSSFARINGRALETQPGSDHSRMACCNIKQDFAFTVNGQTIQLRTQEPQWCRDSNGSGRSSPSLGPSNPGPSNPGPSNPGPSNPGPSNPGPSDPGPSNPGPSDPGPSNPGPSDPGPSDPGPSDPGPSLGGSMGN